MASPTMAARVHPFWTIAALLLVFAFSGVFVQLLPIAAPAILIDWKLDQQAIALPLAAILVGSGIGTILGGILADIAGRRVLIGASAALLGIFMALSVLATAPWHLVVTMVLGGIAMGSFFSPGMALVTELTPPHRRALAISFTVASLPVGFTACSAAAAYVLPNYGWHAFFIGCALIAVPSVILFAFLVPESPSFLAKDPSRHTEYQAVLERLGLPPVDVIEATHEEHQTLNEPPLAKRFAKLIRAAPFVTLALFLLFFASNFYGNAVMGWIPISFFQLGFPLETSSAAITSWATATMIATPLVGWLMSHIGLKVVAPVSVGIGAVAMLLLATFAAPETSLAILFPILALGGIGTAGMVTALYTLAAEAFPASMRASGIGLADFTGRAGGVIGAYSGGHLLTAGGTSGFFYVLAGVMILSTLVMVLLLARPKSERGYELR
jgi:AAHS family 4-hydroxybenzoate transporter-like MFS transporter